MYTDYEVRQSFDEHTRDGFTVFSSRTQPANLEKIERWQYNRELEVNPGLRNPARPKLRKGK